LQFLLESDPRRTHRQVGIVDPDGTAASHTGTDCLPWAGGRTGPGYAVQGNVLVGEEVVVEMERAFVESDPDAPLARRLLAALTAGDDIGGDSRGRQSAALLVVREGAGYGGLDDVAVDLRVDDHEEPVGELTRLLALHELYLTASTEAERLPVDDELRAELEAFAADRGFTSFMEWVGTENYEMRVAPDLSWIDQLVLDVVRSEEAAS
jgi:uncharacterized Ntn-hydrolase superfamily protein